MVGTSKATSAAAGVSDIGTVMNIASSSVLAILTRRVKRSATLKRGPAFLRAVVRSDGAWSFLATSASSASRQLSGQWLRRSRYCCSVTR